MSKNKTKKKKVIKFTKTINTATFYFNKQIGMALHWLVPKIFPHSKFVYLTEIIFFFCYIQKLASNFNLKIFFAKSKAEIFRNWKNK